jgi:sugar phosphate isomerase/epimerase
MIELGSQLGVSVLVFGSPKNRNIGHLKPKQAEEIAIAFFADLGQVAVKYGIKFCLEPNPTVYGCNFINNSEQGYSFVTQVNSEGFGLHLDAACMTLSQEKIQPALAKAIEKLSHFHISEPNLNILGEGNINHQIFAATLKNLNYPGWKSVEMIAKHSDNNLADVTKALEIAIRYYGKE